MSHVRVTAPLVLAKDPSGRVRYEYAGAVITYPLSDFQRDHFLQAGLVEELKGGDEATDEGGKPAKTATKAVLVDWLDAHGDYDREELESQNKDQLWELIDATE
jgi:hypothetical protein